MPAFVAPCWAEGCLEQIPHPDWELVLSGNVVQLLLVYLEDRIGNDERVVTVGLNQGQEDAQSELTELREISDVLAAVLANTTEVSLALGKKVVSIWKSL